MSVTETARTTEDAPFEPLRGVRVGGLAALALVLVLMNGMYLAFLPRELIVGVLDLGTLLLLLIGLVAGARAATHLPRPGRVDVPTVPRDLVTSAIAGFVTALGAVVVLLALDASWDLRSAFPNLSPQLRGALAGDGGPFDALVSVGVPISLMAILGGASRLVDGRIRRAVVIGIEVTLGLSMIELVARDLLGNFGLTALHRSMWVTNSGIRPAPAAILFLVATGLALALGRRGSRDRRFQESEPATKRQRNVRLLLGLAAVVVLPAFLGLIINELLVNVGIFLLMALGLNIVIGYAGMLNLGSIAFFAVGAYGMAVLTSPTSPTFNPSLSWWAALPIVVGLSALAGLLIGAPVIGLRGDYLAIVTLGFSEIIRLLFLSDWLAPYFGAAQGIRSIPGIDVGVTVVSGIDPRAMFYITAVFVVLAIYVSRQLQDSRVGRAWAALREDESTAQAMGIDTQQSKLLAFVIGAILASFGGALFAAKVGTVFPNSFALLVSIIILVVVIVGGMGHIPGVIVGAIVLIGILGGPRQPGLLQEFGEYKLLIYGAVLIYMMLQRPEGLVPSVRRSRELHAEEFSQDAWFDRKGRFIEDGTEATDDGEA
jgi:branched-chain amino acid transport system permease protein